MTPAERRAELCGLLALGLVRLRMRDGAKYLTKLEKVAYTIRPTNAVMQLQLTGEMHDEARSHPRAPGRAQDHADAGPEAQWRDLFDSEPPPFNRRYLESRLAYRIQELAYGGLKPETVRRLERLGEELDGGDRKKSRIRADRDRPSPARG
jgi:hypothetical protein